MGILKRLQPRAPVVRSTATRSAAPTVTRKPPPSLGRMYHAARPSRIAGSQGQNSSADMELVTSLTALRSRARQLVRDASYAKRAQLIVVNNVIGSGIGMQAQVKNTRGDLHEPLNDTIEAEFGEWGRAESCHTGGALHFHDFERALKAQIFGAGEVFVRLHYRTFGPSRVPLALELIEAERIADDVQPGPASPGNMVRMGIEVDQFYRPQAYFFRSRHQGDYSSWMVKSDLYVERVPAADVYHLKITDRWPQTRGEPWLHAVIRRLEDMDGYSEAEIIAARGASSYVWWIKSPEDPNAPIGQEENGEQELTVEPGMSKRLAPGEDIVANQPNRPNPALDPFMRYMLREVASGIGVSYESLSRDYSQSNYSSSRLALLDDRDLWRYFQAWFIRSFREPLHRLWMQQAVLGGALPQIPVNAYWLDRRRYEAVLFRPRGWAWIDPEKEAKAAIMEIRNGLDTRTAVIARNGGDVEEIDETRERELKAAKARGLAFDSDPDKLDDGTPIDTLKPDDPPPQPEAEPTDDNEPATERVLHFRR